MSKPFTLMSYNIVERTKELTEPQIQTLRNQVERLRISEKHFVMYNLVQKQSNSGLFKNQRLLILNTRLQNLGYLSKMPQYLLPFLSQEEIQGQPKKEVLFKNELENGQVTNFSCREIDSKNGVEIKFQRKGKKCQWIYYFGNRDMSKSWLHSIQFIFMKSQQQIDQNYRQYMSLTSKQYPSNSVDPSQKQKTEKENPSLIEDVVSELQKKQNSISQFNEFEQQKPFGSFIKSNQSHSPSKQSKPGQIYINYKESRTDSRKDQLNNNIPLSQGQSNTHLLSNISKYEMKNSNSVQNKLNQSKQIVMEEPQSIDSSQSNTNQNQPNTQHQKGDHRQSSERFNQSLSIHQKRGPPSSREYYYSSRRLNLGKQSEIWNMKQSDSVKKIRNWNKLYDESTDKIDIYTQFVQQALNYFRNLVDELPITKSLKMADHNQQCYRKQSRGIQFQICYHPSRQNSLIDEVSDPHFVDTSNQKHLRRTYFEQRNNFFKDKSRASPLMVMMDYKGIIAFCRAIQYNQIRIEDKVLELSQAHQNFSKQLSFIERMENLDFYITSSKDLFSALQRFDIIDPDFAYLYRQTSVMYFRQIFYTEICAQTFVQLLKSELRHIIQDFPLEKFQSISLDLIDDVLLQCAFLLINRLLSFGTQSAQIWKFLEQEILRKYKVREKKQNVLSGYLLSAIFFKTGLEVDWKQKMSYKVTLFEEAECIGKSNIKSFQPIIVGLDIFQMNDSLKNFKHSIINQEMNKEQLVSLLDEKLSNVPEILNELIDVIALKLAKIHVYQKGSQKEDPVYIVLDTDEPYSQHYHIFIEALKCLLKQKSEGCQDLSKKKIDEILFWCGKNPIISKIYDALSEHFMGVYNVEKSIKYCRQSLESLIFIFGEEHFIIIDKKYQLSQALLEGGRRQECLKQLLQCKNLIELLEFTSSKLYTIVLSLISNLYLNMNKTNESISNGLSALKALQNQSERQDDQETFQNQLNFINTAEILLRSFEIENRRDQSIEMGKLCYERFCGSSNVFICQRMVRIILYPLMKNLNYQETKSILSICQHFHRFQIVLDLNSSEIYEYMKLNGLISELNKRIMNCFRRLDAKQKECTQKKYFDILLEKNHQLLKQRNIKNESLRFLVDIFLLFSLVKVAYIEGLLRDNYYD